MQTVAHKIAIAILCSLSSCLCAQSPVVVDATAQGSAPIPVQAALGSSTDPAGRTLRVNSQYLLLDGKPWLPVMGELHYSRVPADQWEAAILRMKSGGVSIISSYVIWIHHEQQEGRFDWTGQRDLRRFTKLCAKHGMYFYPRIGPWAHAEVRNGGLPDWVVAQGHTRENDPTYLKEVQDFYAEIGQQLQGLNWKDGGPIVGIQIENEYRATGDGKGSEHIRTLKQMAIKAGLDVPLYTVTGWDGAAIPLDAALPVFGGYPDAPWESTPKAIPSPEVYAFRFDNRSAGNMGAIGGSGQAPADAYRGTPFLTAELGGGIQDTYFRRPVVSADDIAAVLPVMLGSGANMLGYYMFYGGRNPDGGDITLQESQRTGYPTDVPVKSYDFQAPISNNGEERESYRRLKLFHYFLQDFGELLAPMQVHRPSIEPRDSKDFSVPRLAVRSSGKQGFVFFNNHVRNGPMPNKKQFQVHIDLPHGQSTNVPAEPLDLPSGAYGIWPFNLPLGDRTLRYSTAEIFKRVMHGNDEFFYFFAIPGIKPEFLIDTDEKSLQLRGFSQSTSQIGTKLVAQHGRAEAVLRAKGKSIHLVLLSRTEAEGVWRLPGSDTLLYTQAQVLSDNLQSTLQQQGNNSFAYQFWLPVQSELRTQISPKIKSVPQVKLSVSETQVHAAGMRGPLTMGPTVAWRKDAIAMSPEDRDFLQAAKWTLRLHGRTDAPQLSDVLLRFHYVGDVARLTQSNRLDDDSFWNGLPWSVGLHTSGIIPSQPFSLSVLPLPANAPMYLQARAQVNFHGKAQVSELNYVDVVPVYTTTVSTPNAGISSGKSESLEFIIGRRGHDR